MRAMANASESEPHRARNGKRNTGSDNAAHLELRKRHIANRFEKHPLISIRHEVCAIVEPHGPVALEKT